MAYDFYGYNDEDSDYNYSNDPLPSTQTTPNYGTMPTGLDSFSSSQNIDWSALAGQGGNALIRALQGMRGNGQQNGGSNLSDLSKILGAFSQGEKSNRSLRGLLTQNYDDISMRAQEGRNRNESDAIKKLGQTSYITGGGSKFKPSQLDINGKHYDSPDLGYGPTPISDAEKEGASSLQPQLLDRLKPGGSYTPQPLDSYASPGMLEDIGSYGAAGVGGLDTILSMLGRNGTSTGIPNSGNPEGNEEGFQQGNDSTGKNIGQAGQYLGLAKTGLGIYGAATGSTGAAAAGSTIGKALPAVGAAAGIYGLSKNQNTQSNVMNGMTTGLSVGSYFGPYGAAIGAGAGALYGALQSWLTVTEQEKEGRVAQGTAIKQLASIATPEQIEGSKRSGWPDPNQALGLIVMRDTFMKSGMSENDAFKKASDIMQAMWGAEGGGANDVSDAFTPFVNHMGGQRRNG